MLLPGQTQGEPDSPHASDTSLLYSQPPPSAVKYPPRHGLDRHSLPLLLSWLSFVVYAINLFVLRSRVDESVRFVVHWLDALLMLGSYVFYFRKHGMAIRVKLLARSVYLWQLVTLLVVNGVVTVLYPALSYYDQSAFVSALLSLVAWIAPVLLDACNASALEIRVTTALLIFAAFTSLYGNHFVWEDSIIIHGTQDNATGVWDGRVTKNEVRRTVMTSVLFLMGSSLRAMLKDTKFRRMYWVKQDRIKCDIHARWETGADVAALRDESWTKRLADKLASEDSSNNVNRRLQLFGMHWSFALCVLVIFANWVMVTFIRRRQTDKGAPWLVAWQCAFSILTVVLSAIYMRLFYVHARLRDLLTSLPAWQVVLLFSAYAIANIVTHRPVYHAQNSWLAVALCTGFIFTICLDLCDSTRVESLLSLFLVTAICVSGFAGTFVWQDRLVFQGFRQEGGLWIGQYTKNQITRSCLTTVLLLLFLSVHDVFTDTTHKEYYFVRDCVVKPELASTLWRKVGSVSFGSLASGALSLSRAARRSIAAHSSPSQRALTLTSSVEELELVAAAADMAGRELDVDSFLMKIVDDCMVSSGEVHWGNVAEQLAVYTASPWEPKEARSCYEMAALEADPDARVAAQRT